MLNKVRKLPSLYRYFGLNWLLFRASYAAKLKTGWLARRMPPYSWADRPLSDWLRNDVPSEPEAYVAWRRTNGGRFFFDELPAQFPDTIDQTQIVAQADAILAGNWPYFSHQSFAVGFPPDWQRNPATGQQIAADRHWSQISDFGQGDIKLIWEASRFSVVYALVRAYAVSQDERYAAAFWQLIEDWAAHNPPMLGPNWKCGQETTFRLMAWCFGLYGFAKSVHSRPARVAQLAAMIAAQAERIAGNIAYARSTHSNHGVSEAVGLWTIGLLFPEFQSSRHWRELGRELISEEVLSQIANDGTYIMHSTNYHRAVLQACFWAVRLGEVNNQRLPEPIYAALEKSTRFLYQLHDSAPDQMPNHGSNDGTLVLPLDNCDFTDYRPVLQLGFCVLTGQGVFEPGAWDEPVFWLCDNPQPPRNPVPLASASFPTGGYFTLRGSNSWAMVHCAHYLDRPYQADQLHVDLWWRGHNIACDAGTYSYNSPPPWNNSLARSAAHNTVTVDGLDQMTRITRFTWIDWAQGQVNHRADSPGDCLEYWEGEHDGYLHLPTGVRHRRGILRIADEHWLIVDYLNSEGPHHYQLHWLLADLPYTFDHTVGQIRMKSGVGDYQVQTAAHAQPVELSLLRADADSTRGWYSRYYHDRQPALSLRAGVQANNAYFWTFFGPAASRVLQADDRLTIETDQFNAAIQLDLSPSAPRLIQSAALQGSVVDQLDEYSASLGHNQ